MIPKWEWSWVMVDCGEEWVIMSPGRDEAPLARTYPWILLLWIHRCLLGRICGVEVEVDTVVVADMEEDTADEVEEREARLATLAVAMVTCLATVPRDKSVTTATLAIDLAESRPINSTGGEVGHLSRDCPSETSSERVCDKLGRSDGLQSPGISPEANRWFLAQFEANLPQGLRGWLGAREPGVPHLPADQDPTLLETPQRPAPLVPSSLAPSPLSAPPGTCDPRFITSSPNEAGSPWMLGPLPEEDNALVLGSSPEEDNALFDFQNYRQQNSHPGCCSARDLRSSDHVHSSR